MLRIIDFEDGDRMIKSRKYRGEEDHRYICSFLDQVYNINKNQQNWLSARWEYAAYFISPLYHFGLYRKMQKVPSYRMDLDIVSVYEDNTISSFCTVWFEEKSRTGRFEPVGTHPDHQRKSLGKAV